MGMEFFSELLLLLLLLFKFVLAFTGEKQKDAEIKNFKCGVVIKLKLYKFYVLCYYM